MPKYITQETAPELLGKTVDCFRRKRHYYPLMVDKIEKYSNYFVIDRNGVAMPLYANDRIPYDFVVKEE